jgi:hypothetical protein
MGMATDEELLIQQGCGLVRVVLRPLLRAAVGLFCVAHA